MNDSFTSILGCLLAVVLIFSFYAFFWLLNRGNHDELFSIAILCLGIPLIHWFIWKSTITHIIGDIFTLGRHTHAHNNHYISYTCRTVIDILSQLGSWWVDSSHVSEQIAPFIPPSIWHVVIYDVGQHQKWTWGMQKQLNSQSQMPVHRGYHPVTRLHWMPATWPPDHYQERTFTG